MTTERPQDLFEQASYDLNKFRERRVADRRFQPRGTADRRVSHLAGTESQPDYQQSADTNRTQS